MAIKVAVIIPHFQTKAGVLARTLRAVAAQDATVDMEVVITDDASPVPARNELDDLDEEFRSRIRIIDRPNGGPGAAKNSAIANISPDVSVIALSDCDDLWSERHLSRGLAALDLGYDFYFANHQREHAEPDRFTECEVDLGQHSLIDPTLDLWAWEEDLFDTMLRSTMVVGLSTLVFRRDLIPEPYFKEGFELADDIWFLLEVGRATRKIAFTPTVDVIYSNADNVSVVTDWRTNKSLRLTLSLLLVADAALKHFDLSERQRSILLGRRVKARQDFAVTLLGMLVAGRAVNWTYAKRFLAADKALITALPSALAAMIAAKCRARWSGGYAKG